MLQVVILIGVICIMIFQVVIACQHIGMDNKLNEILDRVYKIDCVMYQQRKDAVVSNKHRAR